MTMPLKGTSATVKSFVRFALLFFVLVEGAKCAQDAAGAGWQVMPGFALVKPQAWSQDSMAGVVEFQAFADRTVKGGQVAGYYVLRTARTPEMQVPAARVIRLVAYPESPLDLVRAEQRAALQKTIEDCKALTARYPSAAQRLEKTLAALGAEAAKFDAGDVKESGKWVPRAAFYKKKADELANLAEEEITSAKNVKSLDLASIQYYVGLEEMAKIEPSVKPQLERVRTLYQSLRRNEARQDPAEKPSSPGTSLNIPQAEVSAQIATLKTSSTK